MFFGGLKLRRPSKKKRETAPVASQGPQPVRDHAAASSISPVRKNRQYVNSLRQQKPNATTDGDGDFWTELAQTGAPLSPYSMLKQITQNNKQRSQQRSQTSQQLQNTKPMPSTTSKASNPSKGQLTGTQKSKHKTSKIHDRPSRQNHTNNGSTSSAVHRLRQLKSTNKTRTLDRRNTLKTKTTTLAVSTAPSSSPFTIFQRQAAVANTSNNIHEVVPPETMSSAMSITGSLSAREEALSKIANSSTQKSPSNVNILETSKELDQLTSVELDQLYLKSVENFDHVKSQWQKLHTSVLNASQINSPRMKSATDKLEEELQRSRKEISTLLAALDLTQARFEEKGAEIEKLKEKTHASLLDTHKGDDHYDIISRKWIDQDKDKLIRALYNAKYERHVMEEELIRSKGESRRDRLAYNNLLNEKFRIIVDKCKEFGELDSATVLQLSSMKRRIADLEEEGKIAHEVYKSRLGKLHDKFAKQFVAMKESNSRSCSTTA